MDIQSLVQSFAKAARQTLGMKEKVVIPFERVKRLLELDSPKYKTEKYRQTTVMKYMHMAYSTRGADVYGSARCAYADRNRRIVIPGAPSSHISEGTRDEYIRSSAAVMTTDYMVGFGRRAIVAVIRQDVKNLDNFFDSMAFGIYGTYDKGGNLRVKKMLVPEIDQQRRMTGLRKVDVSDPAEIETALKFAELCKKQIFSGTPLNARDNMREAMESKTPPSPAPHVS